MIGSTDQANHQYDLADFDAALGAGNLPAVSFLKPAAYEDGHAGYSDPVDEMRWVARVVDAVPASPQWSSTAIIVTYDDSDGWYDHSPSVIPNRSRGASDQAICLHNPPPGPNDYMDRCGPGPRLPFVLVSPYADPNVLNSTVLTQSSITKFIEDNWALGQIGDQSFDAAAADMSILFNAGGATPKTFIDPDTGQVIAGPPAGLTVAPPPMPVVPPTITQPPPTTTTTTTPTDTTPTPAPTPTITRVFAPKAIATGKRKGRTLTLKFRVKGLDPGTAKLAVTVTLAGKRLGKGSATVRSGVAKVVIKARRKVKAGRYKLALKFAQTGRSATQKLTVRVR
jgi:phospholipase C